VTELSGQAVGKGAAYIYIETLAAIISGYVLWIFLSKITTPDIIGYASTMVSLATIFTAVANIGIPNGIQRFLGKSFAEQELQVAKVFVEASLILVSTGVIACSIIMLIGKDWIFNTSDFGLVITSILLMGASTTVILIRSMLVASLKTKTLPITMIIGSTVRISVAVILILTGAGALGIIIAYLLAQIITSIPLGLALLNIFRHSKNYGRARIVTLKESCKSILVAGVPSWVPAFVNALGSNLGIVLVFGSIGASQAGTYFIAFSIFSAIGGISYSLYSIAFPALSSMTDGRKKFIWRLTKMSLIVSLPFSSSLLFYSTEIMELFGRNYIKGGSSLEILLLASLPTVVITGISTLVYSYGNYRQVLIIGLATSIPRTILYFILVPFNGGMGAAISYLIGSIIGFAVSIFIAKKIGLLVKWKEFLYILMIPTGIAFIFEYLGINYAISIFATLVLSYILLLKLGILTKPDLEDSLGLLPHRISNPLLNALNTLGRRLNSSY
jgi:O-antigen/teichoic acid export membrane protein